MDKYTQEETAFLKDLDTLQEVREFYEFRDVFGLTAQDSQIADKKEGTDMAQKYDIKAIHQYKDKDGYKIKIRELGRDIELLAFPSEDRPTNDVGF